jgi:hypothetical protein
MTGATGTVLRDEIVVATDNPHTPSLRIPIYVRYGPPPKPITGPLTPPRSFPTVPPTSAPLPAPR